MKRFFLIPILIIMLFTSCSDKRSAINIRKDKFLGTWVCEVYNNEKKLSDITYKINTNDGKYYGTINDTIKFDDLFATETELFFIKNNKVIKRSEYFFNNDKLIIENNVFLKLKNRQKSF